MKLPTCSVQRRHTLTQLTYAQEAIDEMAMVEAFNAKPVITREDWDFSVIVPVIAFVGIIGLFFI